MYTLYFVSFKDMGLFLCVFQNVSCGYQLLLIRFNDFTDDISQHSYIPLLTVFYVVSIKYCELNYPPYYIGDIILVTRLLLLLLPYGDPHQ